MYCGLDVGRYAVKAVFGPGHAVRFPSYAAPARDRDLGEQTYAASAGGGLDNLKLDITALGPGLPPRSQWFIGALAEREGGTREFTKVKTEHPNTLPLALAALVLGVEGQFTVVPRLVLGLPISDYTRFKQSKNRPPADIMKVNASLREYAAKAHAIFVDYYTPLVDEKGMLRDGYSFDGLHPNEKGYALMAPAAEAAIQAALK